MIIWDTAVYILAFVVTLPIIATLFVYAVSLNVYKHKSRAVHTAVDWTTAFYLIAVLVMFNIIFGQSFTGVMIALLLTLFTIIVVVHWKLRQEIVFRNVFTFFWRICFLLFLGLYCLLVLTGLILSF
ncbi:hypothetical protein GCM10028778_02550 [Barrientosiimonas marina]|uniref:DUF3397 domain-containing protein n=1 Tax=Lentibacillus kimchii TaxID=1542911 RepID=A0ABW2UPV6_9BACI